MEIFDWEGMFEVNNGGIVDESNLLYIDQFFYIY